VLSRIPLWCLLLADNLEGIFVRLAEIASVYRKAGRELLLSCAVGCLWGWESGCFIFLRLGAPATHELSGYMVGLFLTAGLKFGFWLYVIRSNFSPIQEGGCVTFSAVSDTRCSTYFIFTAFLTAECSTVELPGNRATRLFSFYYKKQNPS